MDRINCLFFVLALFVENTITLRWHSTPRDGRVLYPCVGHSVTFRWGYTLSNGDVISSTEWTFHGVLSREMVAMSTDGHFLPTASYSHRVELLGLAGLVLRHVTAGDAGNYSVIVTGHDRSGTSFTTGRSVRVMVGDSLMTDDHDLHARMTPLAVYNNVTANWYYTLTCGHFVYDDDPPITVEWVTPEGRREPSTEYRDGHFTLLLSNPVTEGNYSCRISPSSLNASCLQDQCAPEASVEVNGMLTRMAVMEAEQENLKQMLAEKEGQIHDLINMSQTLQTRLGDLSSCCDANIAPGTVRLVNGGNAMEGRVEVKVGNRWGTVCDDSWDANDAKVVCNMLGYFASGARATITAHFGSGTGPIVLDDVDCNGGEQSLQMCNASNFGTHNCGHGEDAGVICAGL